MLVIVDYGVGNLNSIINLCNRLDVQATVARDLSDIEKATKLILPGVGHFARAMDNLKQSGVIPILTRKVKEEKTPLLGFCVGMQLLAKHSEEGDVDGLGWIDAQVVKFRFDKQTLKLKIPHVGFNTIATKESPIFKHVPDKSRFYFTHSYHLVCRDVRNVIGTTEYGYSFPSVIQDEKIYGTQFHPEKSHQAGINLIRGFVEG
ncbi:MAG: imidazole glycerol phosphate synthase subunit HisH [Deltaproteobacteria bacterium]|nr:imidazole glycerol phosphate synthase subunit HisH [Deltaproteobacteria bacterium]